MYSMPRYVSRKCPILITITCVRFHWNHWERLRVTGVRESTRWYALIEWGYDALNGNKSQLGQNEYREWLNSVWDPWLQSSALRRFHGLNWHTELLRTAGVDCTKYCIQITPIPISIPSILSNQYLLILHCTVRVRVTVPQHDSTKSCNSVCASASQFDASYTTYVSEKFRISSYC